MKKFLVITFLSLSFITPVAFAAAQGSTPLNYGGFVNCDGVVATEKKDGVVVNTEPGRTKECDFAALIALVQKMINWLFYISIPLATVLFAYAGLLHLSGKESNIKKSWAIFQAVAIGFIIMLVAWFGVNTILQWFASPNSGATTLIGK